MIRLWIKLVDLKRKSCRNCKAKHQDDDGGHYAVGIYVRGKWRNVIDRVCRHCWDREMSQLCVNYAPSDYALVTYNCSLPWWMDDGFVNDPKLTETQTHFLSNVSKLCRHCFSLSRADLGQGVVGTTGVTFDVKDWDDGDAQLAALKDWCQENNVKVHESRLTMTGKVYVWFTFGLDTHCPVYRACESCQAECGRAVYRACESCQAECGRVASTKIVKKDGEYIVRAYNANGVRIPQADYFTTDKADAEGTARLMIGASSGFISHV